MIAINFKKILPVRVSCFTRSGGQQDLMTVRVATRNFTKIPKRLSFSPSEIHIRLNYKIQTFCFYLKVNTCSLHYGNQTVSVV